MSYSNKKLILRALAIFLFLALLSTAYYFFGGVLRSDLDGKRSDLESRQPGEESQNKDPRIYPEPIEVAPLPKYTGAPIGVINEDKTVSGSYPEATKTKLRNELLEIESSLRGGRDPSLPSGQAPQSLDSWLRAGVIKKFFGDYPGARDLWEYASLIRPQNSTSFANLGGLYALYLKDPAKAEFNYKKAIENSPGDIYLYTSLADLYSSSEAERSSYSSSEAAPSREATIEKVVKTIQSGLAFNPDNQTLLSYLARFYKEQNNIPKALEYYKKVLVLDPTNQAVAAEIEVLKKK